MKDHSALDLQAMSVLRMNDRGKYTVPTESLYPHQWNWDSAFAAIGLSTFDIERSWTELVTLVKGQWECGMIPHILFYRKGDDYFPGPGIWGSGTAIPSSGLTQPPVATTAARRIWSMNRRVGEDRMRSLYPKLKAWHAWFMKWRLDRGAVCATHPWESGRDNAPDWDDAMERVDPADTSIYERHDTKCVDPDMRPTKRDYDRYLSLVNLGREAGWDQRYLLDTNPFRVADPALTFILLRANKDLAAIGRELGEDVTEVEAWTDVLERGAETLWNPEIESYDSRDALSGAWSGCVSSASFLCWYAGLQSEGMEEHFRRISDSVTYSVPSHDPDSEKFDPLRYWRGPVWPVVNSLIGIGLAETGHDTEAVTVLESTTELIERGGFHEYYNPHDGSPAGGGSFTWTAAIWLAWASPNTGASTWA